MRYVHVALNLPIFELFDYFVSENIASMYLTGCRVIVPFGKNTLVGLIVRQSSKTNIKKIRPIIKLVDHTPLLSQSFLDLTKAVSEYYCSSWGQAIATALPAGIRKGSSVTLAQNIEPKSMKAASGHSFIQNGSFQERLDLYKNYTANTTAQKKSVIIVSPEINSCFHIYQSLKDTVRADTIHRKKGLREELLTWEKARNNQLDCLIGTRSAVFAPLSNVGLIIVDNEAAYGHKEEQMPCYHARDVALMRAHLEGFPVIMAGQSYSLETYQAIKRKKYQLIGPPQPRKQALKISLVDLRQYGISKSRLQTLISPVLEDKLHKALSSGKKAIVFINRKGFASLAFCQKCSFILKCDACSNNLIFCFDEKKMLCPACAAEKELITVCPKCQAHYIKYAGFGIEKVKSQLQLLFPDKKIERLDKEHRYISGACDIMVGTEMMFHQEHAPKAELVAAIDIDSALNTINFRNNEKLYSLLYALKALASEELVLQTRMVERYQRKDFLELNLSLLFDDELKERKALALPPFMHLAMLNIRGKINERAKNAAMDIYEKLKNTAEMLAIFEPIESVPFKLRGKFRYHILLKSKKAKVLGNVLRKSLKKFKHTGIVLTIDVDPQ